MHLVLWCFILLTVVTVSSVTAEGHDNAEMKRGESKNSVRSHIPGSHHHRHHHHHRRHHWRYRYTEAIAIGCGMAAGWICVATVVYVIRYIRAKKKANEPREIEFDQL